MHYQKEDQIICGCSYEILIFLYFTHFQENLGFLEYITNNQSYLCYLRVHLQYFFFHYMWGGGGHLTCPPASCPPRRRRRGGMTLTHQLNIEAGGEITGQYITVIGTSGGWDCGDLVLVLRWD